MLLGEFKHQCDDKFRLRMPAKFKKEFLQGYVVCKGNSGCLFLLAKKEIENILQKIENLPLFNPELQKPLRLLFSSAFEPEEDNQGRFLLPQNLREYAGIKKDVVFVGVGTRAELWSQENWQKFIENTDDNFDSIVAGLGAYGI